AVGHSTVVLRILVEHSKRDRDDRVRTVGDRYDGLVVVVRCRHRTGLCQQQQNGCCQCAECLAHRVLLRPASGPQANICASWARACGIPRSASMPMTGASWAARRAKDSYLDLCTSVICITPDPPWGPLLRAGTS